MREAALENLDIAKYLLIAVIFIPLERLWPRRRNQKILRRLWRVDIAHLVFSGLLIRAGGIMIVVASIALGQEYFPAAWRDFIAGQHFALQVFIILIIADLGFYWVHRLFHQYPSLWRIHAIHHSIEEMDWLAAHRVHPIDQVLTRMATLAPVFFIGFSNEALVAFLFLYKWQALLVHSNINIPFGPFRWIAASPEFHHWHHANEPESLDKNFAGQLPIIDKLFGTAYMPKNCAPNRYGTDTPVPDNYIDQMFFPFRSKNKNQRDQPIISQNDTSGVS